MSIAAKIAPQPLDRTRHAAPQVFEQLRGRIVSLALEPGVVLQRAELADAFGLSQTPIRDALMRLGEEGLVDIFPQHATVVSRIDVAAARQAQFLRRSVEAEIVRVLAQRNDPVLAKRLIALVDRQQQMVRATVDYGDFDAADHAFHHALYDAVGLLQVWTLIRSQSGHVDRLRRLRLPVKGKLQAVVHEHRRIVDAVASGDPLVAAEHLRDHLPDMLPHLDGIRRDYPEFLTGFDRLPVG